MNQDDYPHQQRRFLDEFEAWIVVEQVAPSKLLTEMPRLQLVAKPTDPPLVTEPKREQPESPAFKPKSIPEPLTDIQLRDRREMLTQQLASLARSSKA